MRPVLIEPRHEGAFTVRSRRPAWPGRRSRRRRAGGGSRRGAPAARPRPDDHQHRVTGCQPPRFDVVHGDVVRAARGEPSSPPCVSARHADGPLPARRSGRRRRGSAGSGPPGPPGSPGAWPSCRLPSGRISSRGSCCAVLFGPNPRGSSCPHRPGAADPSMKPALSVGASAGLRSACHPCGRHLQVPAQGGGEAAPGPWPQATGPRPPAPTRGSGNARALRGLRRPRAATRVSRSTRMRPRRPSDPSVKSRVSSGALSRSSSWCSGPARWSAVRVQAMEIHCGFSSLAAQGPRFAPQAGAAAPFSSSTGRWRR